MTFDYTTDLTTGEYIHMLRRRAGLSLQDCAGILGVKCAVLRAWERDRVPEGYWDENGEQAAAIVSILWVLIPDGYAQE